MNFTATTHRSITHTITIDDEEIVVEFPPDELIDGFRSEDGNLIRFAVRDEDSADYEFDENVEFAHDDYRYVASVSDIDSWVESRIDDPTVDVFPVLVRDSSYEVIGGKVETMEEWESLGYHGAITIPNERHDCPFTDTQAAADSILEEYTSWANGEVYGLVEMARNDRGRWEETDLTVWNLIGSEYVQQAVTEGNY